MRKRCIQKLSNSPKVTEAMSDKWGSTPILRPEDPHPVSWGTWPSVL